MADQSSQWWSSAGSAGTVDVADLGIVAFDKSIVQLKGFDLVTQPLAVQSALAFPVTRAVIRYGVTPVQGVLTGVQLSLRLRYRDGSGQVVAHLIEVDIPSGTETVRITFDSTQPGGTKVIHDNAFQVFNSGDTFGAFDFTNHAYYVELTLTAAQSPIRPILFPPKVSVIQLAPSDIILRGRSDVK